MTAAKIMDIISRLPGCDGQAADAISAYTQVKMEDAHKLLNIPRSECPDIWIRLPRQKWPKSWSSMEDPVVPLDRNLYGHPLAGLLWERQFQKVLLEHDWGKVFNWDCSCVNRARGLFLSVFVDDFKLSGKTENIDPILKVLNKEVDLGEPTSFLDHVYLGCTQRECQISNDIVTNFWDMFESRISQPSRPLRTSLFFPLIIGLEFAVKHLSCLCSRHCRDSAESTATFRNSLQICRPLRTRYVLTRHAVRSVCCAHRVWSAMWARRRVMRARWLDLI